MKFKKIIIYVTVCESMNIAGSYNAAFLTIRIFHSLISLWAAIHQDEDDIFDPSSFTVIQNFRGSFQMPNQVFTDELATNSSNKSQTLATELGTKVGPLITYIL